jgi:hypothetical protein
MATGEGTFRVRLGANERELLHALPGYARELIAESDPSTARVFPPAHPDDPEAEAGYRDLVGSSLAEGTLAALAVLGRTAGSERLSQEELNGWLAALETLRLVLGTQLGVTEDSYREPDPRDPEAPRLALYHWLSWLQDEVVQALATTLRS